MVVCLQVGVTIKDKTYEVSEIRGVKKRRKGENQIHPWGCGILVGNRFYSKSMEGTWDVVRMRLGSLEGSRPTARVPSQRLGACPAHAGGDRRTHVGC